MFFITCAKNVSALNPYFLGVGFGTIATIADSNKERRQIRVGLIWWHIGVTFNL